MSVNNRRRYLMVVNVDWFFLSHRLELALMMIEKGYEVYVLAKNTGRRKEIEKYNIHFIDIDFERSGVNPINELKIIHSLKNIYKKLQPELIHHVTIKPAIYGSMAAKGLQKVKVFNAISGLGFNFIDGRNGLVQKVVLRLMKFAFTKNVNFIFQNPDDLQVYEKLGFLDHQNFRLIKGAGVNHYKFGYENPISTDKVNVVFTARMLYDKGLQELIDAALVLYPVYAKKVQFWLVGDLDLENPSGISSFELERQLIPDYLLWKGYKENVKEVLIQAHIVCLPSYREGLPKSLIEAMAIGRPIVTTDVPGCRECVEDNYNGFLVKDKDVGSLVMALETLINNEVLRLEMGKASREKMVAELSLQKVLQETWSFYES